MIDILIATGILIAPILVYYAIIRPRLKASFTDTYAHVDAFWARWYARLWAFRSFILTVGASLLAALPNLLTGLMGVDFTWLPAPWPMYVGAGLSIALVIVRAFATTPKEEPPK